MAAAAIAHIAPRVVILSAAKNPFGFPLHAAAASAALDSSLRAG